LSALVPVWAAINFFKSPTVSVGLYASQGNNRTYRYIITNTHRPQRLI